MTSKKLNLVILHLALGFFVQSASSQDVQFTLNTKKVIATTSDKFLSLTIDPAVLLTGDVLTSSTELSTNIAKALAPGYVRLAGPRSNSYTFERSLFPQSGYEDPDLTFSEAHWVLVQQWAQRAGLDVVSSLTPRRNENDDQSTTWDPRNSLDLISFSDHMGYNMSWQLGYECQIRCDVSGSDLGRDVARLRNMLSAFPRYSNSIIVGPDIVSFRGKQQQQFIQDYLAAAGNALTAVTWHPDFAGVALDSDGVALQIDTLAADRDLLYKAMGRSVAKKPLWIAESKPEECKRQFLGALVWARRLGNAAKAGVQVIMRQPDPSNIFQPTPDYWVSLLHKMLVGREVLDAKLTSGNKTHVHFYCQCTKPSAKYDRGAVTIFGINLTPGKVSVTLKGLKIKALHKYILMPGFDTDDRMFAETVLLNNEPLALDDGKNVPEINPAVSLMGKNMAVKLPSGGIGFWVIPGARVKSCLGHDEELGDKNLLLKKLTKKLEDSEAGDENIGHEIEDDNREQESDVESTEDIKSLLKSKKKKRKYRHSEETEDEDRRFKRIDTKKELEKLEKFLKRNGNNDEKKTSHLRGRGALAMLESGEIKEEDTSEEDAGLLRLKKNENSNSGEEIRTKIEEYKNKLVEYEARKNDDKTRRIYSRRFSQPEEQLSNDVDTQKAVEALALISRVESAIRDVGSSSSEKINHEEEPGSLKPLNLEASDIGEEMMIEELEKSDKTKRMIDSKYLGDKIYRYFVGGGQKNVQKRNLDDSNTNSPQRDKRDLEKLLGDDPLGLRKEGLFKKRLKTDEVKEKRFERRNRKKEKEEMGIKKELQVPRYEHRIADSDENNFFGFPQMKPVENFPQGDVFLSEGSSSEEKSHDYEYVEDDDDEEEAKKQQKKRNKRKKAKSQRQQNVVQDETWVEEPNSNLQYGPNEFFEKVNFPKVVIKTQWKNYGELYEPEAVQQDDFKEEFKAQENETTGDAVIARDQTDEREDKRAKETAVKKLIKYYDNSEGLRIEPSEFERPKNRPKEVRKVSKSRTQTPAQRKSKIKPEELTEQGENTEKILQPENDQYEDGEDLGSLEFVNSKAVDDYSDEDYVEEGNTRAKKRTKRKIANLDLDVFAQEMIREDAGNLKDCKCRVIRSTGRMICKNCKRTHRLRREITESDLEGDVQPPFTDQTSIFQESPTEVLLPINNEAPEIIQGEFAPRDIPSSEETSSVNDSDKSPQKNIEVADLNGDAIISEASIDKESGQDFSSQVSDGEVLAQESSSPATVDGDLEEIGLNEAAEPENQLRTEPEVISGGTEGEIGEKETNDDVVGSQRLKDDGEEGEGADDEETGESATEFTRDVEGEKETIRLAENLSAEDVADDKNAKRDVPLTADANLGASSSTKISLSTKPSLGSSAKSEFLEKKTKSGVDFRLKSAGLKSNLGKSKLVLNTEALSALIKENESKKADVTRAMESSSKLKSVDNAKYVEYQRKRDEKLAILKEKLRERKAKILQQYRQELLDALTKCDSEVERNLKRREIWDDFSNQEEFRDFVDKEKLAYLMMNRPVNYEDFEELENGYEVGIEDRKYHPEIDVVLPLKNPREQKIPSNDYRGFYYGQKSKQFAPPSREFISRKSSIEDVDEPYYAIVESLENPQIIPKQHFDDLQQAYKNEYDEFIKTRDSELEKSWRPSKPDPRKYHPAEQTFHQRQNSARGYPERQLPFEEPALRVYDEDFSSYNQFPDRDGNVLAKTHWPDAPVPQNKRYEDNNSSWYSLIPEYHEGILHHRQNSGPNHQSPGSRQKIFSRVKGTGEELAPPKRVALHTGAKSNTDELFGNEIADIQLREGWRILKKLDSPCSGEKSKFGETKELDEPQTLFEQRDFSQGEPLVRIERHLVPYEKQILDEPAYLTVRRERDVKEKASNYVCLREDSSEDSGEDDERIFKLVRNGDHYEAVPISDVQGDLRAGKGRKSHRRVPKQVENVRRKGRKYNAEVFSDEEGNYYLKNGAYQRGNLAKSKYPEDREMENFQNQYQDDGEGKSHFRNYEIDHRSISDGPNRLESYPSLTPEEYELLMLIPVKKHKVVKRQKREMDNSIDRWGSFEETNSVWNDAVRVGGILRDFEDDEAKDLKKIELQDPGKIEKFKKVILNLGSHDQDGMAVVAQSRDDSGEIHLEEYPKQEIIKQVNEEREEATILPSVTGTTTPLSLFDSAMPKLENAINGELEKVGNLTESLEDFITDFEKKFNGTLDANGNVTRGKAPIKNDKISCNIFHSAIKSVKKFFDFLAGISLIFGRH